MRDERAKQIIDVWKTIVEVQKHFNDISMKIRSTFITILIALFASIGFLWEKKFEFIIFSVKVQFVALIPLIGFVGTALFYFIDRYWYHRLLVGSVKHAMEIENKYKHQLPELGLSDAIGKESPIVPRGFMGFVSWIVVSEPSFVKEGKLRSDGKIELFYKSVMALLLVIFVLLLFSGTVSRV